MRCLVLGGRGFLGTRIVTRLLEKQWDVTVFTRKRDAISPKLPAGATLIEGDFLNEKDVAQALQGCDVCVHSITSTSPQSANRDPLYDVQSNLLPTINLLRLLPSSSIKKLIFLSSSGVYGNPKYSPIDENHPTSPLGAYAITKLAIEHHCAVQETLEGMNYRALRVANPYGPGQKIDARQGAIGIFMTSIFQDKPITIWGDGQSVRDYIYVDDVANAVTATIDYEGPVRTFNIGAGIGHTVVDAIQAIERITGKKAVLKFEPSRSFDIGVNVLDISLARRELNWKPETAFEDGLEKLANWLAPQLRRH